MAAACANPICTAQGTKRCARCKHASYCSSTCQKQNWPHHKSACKSAPASSVRIPPTRCSKPGCAARLDHEMKICARCNNAAYCTTLCQSEDWDDHKSHCRNPALAPGTDKLVMAVTIHAQDGGGGRYSELLLQREHSIFQTPVVLISRKLGFPLLVARSVEQPADGIRHDNQHATWLMMDPVTGCAPAEWQGAVGNVIVARADGKSLPMATLGAITDYVSDILDAFGDGAGAAAKYYDRGRFCRFLVDHLKMQRDFADLQIRSSADGSGRNVQG